MDVLIVDDHQVVNEVFKALASKVFERANVTTLSDLGLALQGSAQRSFDLVLLDLGLPGCSGIEALERFRVAFPAAPLLVISASEDPGLIQESLDAGASGYIAKTASLRAIGDAMRVVAAGGRYVPIDGLRLPTH